MSAKPFSKHGGRFSRWKADAVLVAVACWVCPAAAQTIAPVASPSGKVAQPAAPEAGKPAASDGSVVQAGCSSCGNGLGAPGFVTGECGVGCVPGRTCVADGCEPDSVCGRLVHGLYECVCCPDPCYEPRWVPLADAAFFVDAARPQTQMRFRYDAGFDLKTPDRAEYFWAREKTNPNQLEPTQPGSRHGTGKGPSFISKRVEYEDLSLYVEGAAGNFGAFVETPYRELGPDTAAISPKNPALNKSGFGDLTVGTKSLLLDCELVQVGFQFKTFIPVADFGSGLGTGHVSLEPAILFSLRVTPCSYVQGELAYWIPIGGDDLYQGNIFHMHYSLNHVLWQPRHDVQLIGTLEMNEWSVLGGNYTNPDFLITVNGKTGPVPISATTGIFSIGPGLRLFFCDKVDLGVGTAFALTGARWAGELIRTEFRWRF
jgi:hypothetical protein